MRVTERTRMALAFRRQQRDLKKGGWDYLDQPVWQLRRGNRQAERIIGVCIGLDGRSLFVKTAKLEDYKCTHSRTNFMTLKHFRGS